MRERRTGEYVGAFLGGVVGLVFVNTVLLWQQYTRGVILDTWANILWAADLSLVVSIAGNLLLCFYRPARLSALFRVLFAATGLLSVAVFYAVFPLDFSVVVGTWLNTLVRAALIVGIAGGAIGLVVELVRLASVGSAARAWR